MDLTASFRHLTPETLRRIALTLEEGGRPLRGWESKIARRALRIAGQDVEDAAAILYVAADAAAS